MNTRQMKSGRAAAGANGTDRMRRLAVGYVRVSTTGQGTHGISLDAQRTGIEEFAKHADYRVIEIFDDIASGVGAQSFVRREGLRRALDLAIREDADLIVWDWDRLSRHSAFDEQIRQALPDRDRVVCAKRGNTLRDAARSATFDHAAKVAEEISRTTRDGMARKRAEGAVFGNPDIRTDVQPLGAVSWSNAANDLARRIADVLRDLEDPFAITHSKAADILNAKGLRTLHGKEWNASRVRGPLKKARALLRAEADTADRAIPGFGRF